VAPEKIKLSANAANTQCLILGILGLVEFNATNVIMTFYHETYNNLEIKSFLVKHVNISANVKWTRKFTRYPKNN
jgi:hypothetical protein